MGMVVFAKNWVLEAEKVPYAVRLNRGRAAEKPCFAQFWRQAFPPFFPAVYARRRGRRIYLITNKILWNKSLKF
jgi:hypothetical protein